MGPSVSLETAGADQLAKSLAEFGPQVARRVIKTGLRSGVAVLARAQRAAVPPTRTPGGRADIKSAIGSRVKRLGRGLFQAKAGGGVGVRAAKIRKQGSGRRGGIGISAANIHWYLLGTGPRWTGAKTSKTRKGITRAKSTGKARMFRGRMPAHPFIRAASAAALGPAQFAMRQAIARGIGREWARRQKKLGSRY